jgi:hypothetical protein
MPRKGGGTSGLREASRPGGSGGGVILRPPLRELRGSGRLVFVRDQPELRGCLLRVALRKRADHVAEDVASGLALRERASPRERRLRIARSPSGGDGREVRVAISARVFRRVIRRGPRIGLRPLLRYIASGIALRVVIGEPLHPGERRLQIEARPVRRHSANGVFASVSCGERQSVFRGCGGVIAGPLSRERGRRVIARLPGGNLLDELQRSSRIARTQGANY